MDDWQKDLQEFFQKKEQRSRQQESNKSLLRTQVNEWFEREVMPALHELQKGLVKYGKKSRIHSSRQDAWAELRISNNGIPEYTFRVVIDVQAGGTRSFPSKETILGRFFPMYRNALDLRD